MKIASWRLYLSGRLSPGDPFIVISNAEAKRLRKHFETDGRRSMLSISTGDEGVGTPRTFYLNIDQVIALEPLEAVPNLSS